MAKIRYNINRGFLASTQSLYMRLDRYVREEKPYISFRKISPPDVTERTTEWLYNQLIHGYRYEELHALRSLHYSVMNGSSIDRIIENSIAACLKRLEKKNGP